MITNFHLDNYRFLSNFAPAEVYLDGVSQPWLFPTVEHAYQAAKSRDSRVYEQFQKLRTPAEAKRLGRQIKMHPSWPSRKDEIMKDLLWQKFNVGSVYGPLLIATGDELIVEGNTWGDTYWGKVQKNGEWYGQNKLGLMLMDIRRDLRINQLFANR